MASLQITFEQMFLLVRDDGNPVVLLPHGRGFKMAHHLYIIDAEPDQAIDVRRADLSIISSNKEGDRTPFTTNGSKKKWPDTDWLLDFEDLSTNVAARRIRPELYDRNVTKHCPDVLSARFYMPYGRYGWNWNYKPYADSRWQVGPNPNNHQWLTDIMTFECELEDDVFYELKIDVEGKQPEYVRLQKRLGDDVSLVINNRDLRPEKIRTELDAYLSLDDFQVIYDLAVDGSSFQPPTYHSTPSVPARPIGQNRVRLVKKTRCVGTNCPPKFQSAPIARSSTNPHVPICGGGTGNP